MFCRSSWWNIIQDMRREKKYSEKSWDHVTQNIIQNSVTAVADLVSKSAHNNIISNPMWRQFSLRYNKKCNKRDWWDFIFHLKNE